MIWQLTEAKNKLDELLTRALDEGQQRIHWRGQVVVMLSEADFRRLTGERTTLKEHLLNGPDLSDLDLVRDQSPMRNVPL